MPSPLGGSQLLSDPALVSLELKVIGEMVMAHAIPAQVCLELTAIGGTR